MDNKVQIADKDCKNTYKYICEARDTRTSTSPGRAILIECGLLYNITEDQVDSLWSSSAFDLRLKCFVKCVGEFGNLIIDGRVVTQEMIKLAQELSLGADMNTYTQNVAIASVCGNQVGMDECDTASLAFSCVQEQSPDIVQRAMLNQENSGSIDFAALPSAQSLCRDLSSVASNLNIECRKAYVNQDPNPCGRRAYYNVCGGRNYVLVDNPWTKGIGPANAACMDLGLKLASFETFEEFKCVTDMFALPSRTIYMWVSGSFWNMATKPVWCGSNTPLDTTKYPWNLDGNGKPALTGPGIFVQVVIKSSGSFLKNIPNNNQTCGSLCEN
ncbi:uncharacterized protein LOC135936154 [Cloeon dipterum]|uniref:uncharacterized protein LOC135936154 n=1 Tax=Cloeon dipterum TaxID=197152 RepID=UPI00322072CA